MIIALITGCASKPDQQILPCKGRECKTTDLLDNTISKEEWYCYGKKNGGDWYCGNQADNTKIVAIAARTIEGTIKAEIKEREIEAEPISRSEPIPRLTIKATNKETNKEITNSLPSNTIAKSSELDGYPRDAYTLQIIATSDEEKLQQYIERNEITEPIVAHTLSRGSQWHILLIGIYSGYTEAKNAQLEWTNKHPKHSTPWIRDIGSIQDVLITPEEE